MRREQVSAAVLDLVDELGHEGVTTAGVAQRSGVSESTLLYHFPSRDHLLVAALERCDELNAVLLHADEDAPLDLQGLNAVANQLSLEDPRWRLYLMLKGNAATPNHPACTYFSNRVTRQVAIFTRLFEERRRAGLMLTGLDAAHVARQTIGLWEGLAALWVSDPTFDVGALLLDGVRRITGLNWIELRDIITAPSAGL